MKSRRMRVIVVCAAAFGLTLLPLNASARVGKAFKISGLSCRAVAAGASVTCRTSEGKQPGLTTVEMSGIFPAFAGQSVQVIVARKAGTRYHMVMIRRFGVFTNGHFTLSIPAYNYAAGFYGIDITAIGVDQVLAAGHFRKT